MFSILPSAAEAVPTALARGDSNRCDRSLECEQQQGRAYDPVHHSPRPEGPHRVALILASGPSI